MPEGDSLHRAAAHLQVLVGQKVAVETPHPRAAVKRLAERLDGRVLERVEAQGKNLYLSFSGGVVLRSHLRMNGRWRVETRGAERRGTPWLVLRGEKCEAVLWNGPVLELVTEMRSTAPDIVTDATDASRFRASDQRREIGDALLDQRLVAGIGNIWKAESLWEARVSPWRTLADVSDDELSSVLGSAHRLMASSVAASRPRHQVYRRARTAYWCPGCQVGGDAPVS